MTTALTPISFTKEPPYFDDFKPEKNYVRVLFKPGVSVQVRELTQLQTALQAQINRFGSHIFKDGSLVLGGSNTITNDDFVKVKAPSENGTSYIPEELVGKKLQQGNLHAEVIDIDKTDEGSGFITLYLNYINTVVGNVDTNGENAVNQNTFDKDTDISVDQEALILEIDADETSSEPIGKGTRVSFEEAVYFASGYFIYTPKETFIADKHGTAPWKILLYEVNQNIRTAVDDSSLLDNVLGSPNEAAPGADRIQISLTKKVIDWLDDDNWSEGNLDTGTKKYIRLLTLREGSVYKTQKTQYSDIKDFIAKRTFETHGNYTIAPFNISIKEYIKNERNLDGFYFEGDIKSRLEFSDLTSGEINDKIEEYKSQLVVGLDPSVAYVNGNRVEFENTVYTTIDKARDTQTIDDFAFGNNSFGNYLVLDPDEIKGVLPQLSNRQEIELYDGSEKIGTCNFRGLKRFGSNIRLYVFNVQFTSDKSFTDVTELTINGTTFYTAAPEELVLQETDKNSLVFPLSFDFIETATLKRYDITQRFTEDVNGSDQAVITLPAGPKTFVSNSPSDYVVLNTDEDEIINPTNITLSNQNKTATLTFDGGDVSASDSLEIICTRIRVTTSEQDRRLKNKELKENSQTFSVVENTDGSVDPIVLEKFDIFRIKSITIDGVQVIEKFNLDDGQRDNYYDFGRVLLKSNESISDVVDTTGSVDITIEYDYFDWTGTGDYFSVDSYETYENIPNFQSNIHGLVSLRDVIDFRPAITGNEPDTFGELASLLSPKSDAFEFADFAYYLPRIDKIYIDQYGYIGVEKGIPSLTPRPPRDVNDTMTLYILKIAPYTFSPRGVLPKLVDNKRYTMKDIGKIEKRVSKLEYYTSLSLLENTLFSKQTIDELGDEEFKNGFLVDNFTGHGLGDTANPEYTAALDFDKGILRPGFFMDSVPLQYEEKHITTTEGADISATNVSVKENNLMLEYTSVEEKTLTQDHFTYRQPLNPFNVKNWIGSIELTPDNDTWIETKNLNGVTSINTSQFDPETFGADSELILGTVWNSWQKYVVGESTDNTDDVSSNEFNENDFSYEILGENNTINIGLNSTVERRTGEQTILSPGTEKTTGQFDRVKNISVVPKIRSRIVRFTAKGLRPNTIFYPYFDGVNVINYCQQYEEPAHIPISLTLTIPNRTNQGIEPRPVFQFGENNFHHPVITSIGSGTPVNPPDFTTGALPFYELDQSIKNEIGSEPPGAQLRVDISATPVLPRPPLVSNSKGEIYGTFLIPSNALISFRTGLKKFQLRSDDASKSSSISWAESTYYANGFVQNKGLVEITTTPLKVAQRETEELSRKIDTISIDSQNSAIRPPVPLPPNLQVPSARPTVTTPSDTPQEIVRFETDFLGNIITINNQSAAYYGWDINDLYGVDVPTPLYSTNSKNVFEVRRVDTPPDAWQTLQGFGEI